MEIGIKVGDIMTKSFVYTTPNISITDCAKIMLKRHVGSLIVKEGQKLKGILTEGDVIVAIAKGIKLKNKISTIMIRKVKTIKPSSDVSKAWLIMKRKKIRWLPVVVKNNVIGLITMKDILKIQPALSDIASQNLKIAEEKEKIKRVKTIDEMKWVREGPCHECGVYDLLYKVNGRYLCENCRKKVG